MMLKAIDVWKRLLDGRITRYRCFEILPKGGYCVQSVDFYSLPIDETQLKFLEQQYLELSLEEDLTTRTVIYSTLEETIANYDLEFSQEIEINRNGLES